MKTNINRQKRTETGRTGQKQTKRQKLTKTGRNEKKQTEHDKKIDNVCFAI